MTETSTREPRRPLRRPSAVRRQLRWPFAAVVAGLITISGPAKSGLGQRWTASDYSPSSGNDKPSATHTSVGVDDFQFPIGSTAQLTADDLLDIRPVTLRIAGNEFSIPRSFFLWHVPNSTAVNAITIYAFLPDVTSISKENEHEFLSTMGHGRVVMIFAQVVRDNTPLAYRLQATEARSGPYNKSAKQYGLRAEIPLGENPRKSQIRQELYINEIDGKPESYITCDPNGSVPDPGCEHDFVYLHLLFEVYYGRSFLKDWHPIEEAIKHLFDSFSGRALFINLAIMPA